jgi:hypothetical protein
VITCNRIRSHATNAINAINGINAISHVINAISDKATNPILITHAILHRLSRSHLLHGVRRIGDLNNAARAALAPILGDNDAVVDRDGDVDDVTQPVSVTTINTMDGNAASLDSEMVGWGGDRRATGAAEPLDSGEGRGIADATTMTPMGGPGDDDVKAVGRFRRAGRR